MKPKLARVATGSLGQMWLSSKLKDTISIGQHSLESSGSGSVHSNSKTHSLDAMMAYIITAKVVVHIILTVLKQS